MKINIFIDGINVEGNIVHRAATDISVEIVKPYANIKMGLHIPCFARSEKSFDKEHGDTASELLLKKIYGISRYLDMEMVMISAKLNHAKNSICKLPLQFSTEDFNQKRIELKKLLKQKKLDSKIYQKKLGILRKRAEKYNYQTDEIMSNFFEDSFPMIIPYGTRSNVIGIIEGKKTLKADRAN